MGGKEREGEGGRGNNIVRERGWRREKEVDGKRKKEIEGEGGRDSEDRQPEAGEGG